MPVTTAALVRFICTSPKNFLALTAAICFLIPAAQAQRGWRSPNYADSASGDVTTGDDPIARKAALEGLGKLNGSVVVADAQTGRILTIVNQKTAYNGGYIPCSVVKIPVALAALSESVVDRLTQIRLHNSSRMAMTEALAKSNNDYFATLGEKLGYDRVAFYGKLFGLGEKATLIPAEKPGQLADSTPRRGMGRMTSFGDGIRLTPLELAALVGAVANGGTLYYLQYPDSPEAAAEFVPQVKRHLNIDHVIGDIKPGMMGAVEYGTAKSIGFDPDAPIYGKTGTCTDNPTRTHMGWFGSFTEVGHDRVVVVVMLTGGSVASGSSASKVAGRVYKNLIEQNYYAHEDRVEPGSVALGD